MKAYPSIPYWNKGIYGDRAYLFYKYDGTQIRAEWSNKRGFYKFGTRGQIIDESHEQWGEAVKIFLENFYDSVPSAIKRNFKYIENFVCFAEYYGFNSFAGNHEPTDQKFVKIFDISIHRKGFLTPKEFLKLDISDTPRFLGTSVYNKELINSVQTGVFYPAISLEQLVFEGVVAKGVRKRKGQKQIWTAKIKTNKWLDKVKAQYGEKYLLNELNGDTLLLRS